jgi:hypothetical protein
VSCKIKDVDVGVDGDFRIAVVELEGGSEVPEGFMASFMADKKQRVGGDADWGMRIVGCSW